MKKVKDTQNTVFRNNKTSIQKKTCCHTLKKTNTGSITLYSEKKKIAVN